MDRRIKIGLVAALALLLVALLAWAIPELYRQQRYGPSAGQYHASGFKVTAPLWGVLSMVTFTVEPGSQADLAGLSDGDRLTGISLGRLYAGLAQAAVQDSQFAFQVRHRGQLTPIVFRPQKTLLTTFVGEDGQKVELAEADYPYRLGLSADVAAGRLKLLDRRLEVKVADVCPTSPERAIKAKSGRLQTGAGEAFGWSSWVEQRSGSYLVTADYGHQIDGADGKCLVFGFETLVDNAASDTDVTDGSWQALLTGFENIVGSVTVGAVPR